MADLSRHQSKIVKRYYENRDTLSIQKLGEIVSDLFLADTEKKAAKLWERADKALIHAGADKAKAAKIIADKDLQGLGQIVNALSGGK